jgi:hypothetical protein
VDLGGLIQVLKLAFRMRRVKEKQLEHLAEKLIEKANRGKIEGKQWVSFMEFKTLLLDSSTLCANTKEIDNL